MTLQMMTVGVRRGRFLLRLLAQRIDLKPCAGRKHEQFERAGVEQTRRRGSTVGVDQRGDFVFQHQGENPGFSAGWRSEYLEETRVEVGNRHARQGAGVEPAAPSAGLPFSCNCSVSRPNWSTPAARRLS